jgi:hypothetical protein
MSFSLRHVRSLALVALSAIALACSDPEEGGGPPSGQCAARGAHCYAAEECCSNACSSELCVDPVGSCQDLGEACADASDCCTGSCIDAKCALPVVLGQVGDSCAANEACASGLCDAGKCVSSDYCRPVAAECNPAQPFGGNPACCTRSCTPDGTSSLGGKCAVDACKTIGTDCALPSECCSGTGSCGSATSGTCQPVPSGISSCKTLGEACAAGTECCSKNCKGGSCVQAYSCQAYGDICYAAVDCCSGLCDQASAGAPGRCIDPAGGCVQGGNPCDSGSNCCSRTCKDMGTGVKVCVPAGGCRMTDEYCDQNADCCGSGNSAYGSISCDTAANVAPDTSKTNDYRCSRGQGCNPPGNICGVSTDVNASQNCCVPGDFNGSGKVVCKPDVNEVYRCFGSPPGGGEGTDCPTGYDPNDPQCCKPTGATCEIRDQCCGAAPCAPNPGDTSGVLRCQPADVCKPNGAECSGASDATCCDGLSCTDTVESGWRCGYPSTGEGCVPDGAACSAGGDPCCSHVACTAGKCLTCAPNGNACTGDAQCCSGTCDAGFCRAPCGQADQSCTTSAECCSGFACEIAPGATSGLCKESGGGGTPSCAATYAPCGGGTPCCDSSETCAGGLCTPVDTCNTESTACAFDQDCCGGLLCYTTSSSGTGYAACAGGTTGCVCEQATPSKCIQPDETCAPGHECCFGYCAKTTGDRGVCDGTTACSCFNAG